MSPSSTARRLDTVDHMNGTVPELDSYLICATPRTGSTLLCGLLTSSGVAGLPASYFNRRGLHHYADDWRIARPHDGRIDAAYVRAALAAGTTSNGVFGGRIMAETLPELIADLACADPAAGTDVEVLSAVLRPARVRPPASTRRRRPGGVVGEGAADPFLASG